MLVIHCTGFILLAETEQEDGGTGLILEKYADPIKKNSLFSITFYISWQSYSTDSILAFFFDPLHSSIKKVILQSIVSEGKKGLACMEISICDLSTKIILFIDVLVPPSSWKLKAKSVKHIFYCQTHNCITN